ncbi:hypothetical protein KI387_024308, partial [Taxus chinensis]
MIGKIPQSIGNCKHITDLVQSENFLWGRIPTTLGNQTTFRRLKLFGNSFFGDLDIKFYSSTEVLFSHSNKFSGTLPASSTNCTQLKLLYFSEKRLTEDIPSLVLANCQELRVVSLGSNLIE